MKNKILTLISSLLLALGVLPFAAVTVYADAPHAVVWDEHGNKVRDGFGGCVRSDEFETNRDECVETTEKRTVNTTRKEVISSIMKMDERIAYFDFDKHVLKHSEKVKLDALAQVLIDNDVKKVKVVGYTDRIGNHKYNQNLSERRANAVKHYLDTKVKLDESVVHLRGLGAHDQVKDCNGVKPRTKLIECLAPNRRVEVEIDYYDNMR